MIQFDFSPADLSDLSPQIIYSDGSVLIAQVLSELQIALTLESSEVMYVSGDIPLPAESTLVGLQAYEKGGAVILLLFVNSTVVDVEVLSGQLQRSENSIFIGSFDGIILFFEGFIGPLGIGPLQ